LSARLDIITVDIVAQPSAPDAYPKAVMEALEHYKKYNMIVELATASNYDVAAEKHLKSALINFIQDLKV
jgi:hypothetical protein